MHKGSSGGGANSEELELRVRLVVARAEGRPCTVGEPFARQEVSRVSPARDVGDAILVLGEQVKPTRLVVADVALLLQPLETCVVGVQVEGLVEEIGPQRLERVDHGQELEQVGGYERSGSVSLRDSKATGWNTPASSGCSRMAETASSEASVSRRVGRAGSHTRRTGADVSAALSASKLRCSAAPQVNRARGLQRAVSGAARAEKRSTNLR